MCLRTGTDEFYSTFALRELCNGTSEEQQKELAGNPPLSRLSCGDCAISGGVGSANKIEVKSLYPLMHTFHLSPLLLLHFHHLSLGLYPITPV